MISLGRLERVCAIRRGGPRNDGRPLRPSCDIELPPPRE